MVSRLCEGSETPSAEPSQPQSLTSLPGGLRLLNTSSAKSRQLIQGTHLRLRRLRQPGNLCHILTFSRHQPGNITWRGNNERGTSPVKTPTRGLQRVLMRRHRHLTDRAIGTDLLNDDYIALSNGSDNRSTSRRPPSPPNRPLRSLTITRRLRRGTLRSLTFRARRLTMTAVTLRRRRSPTRGELATLFLSHKAPLSMGNFGFQSPRGDVTMTEGGNLTLGRGNPPGSFSIQWTSSLETVPCFLVVKNLFARTTHQSCVVLGARTWCASRLRPRLLLHRRCAGARSPSRLPPLAIASRWSAVKASGCV